MELWFAISGIAVASRSPRLLGRPPARDAGSYPHLPFGLPGNPENR